MVAPHNKKAHIRDELRAYIEARDGCFCVYCGIEASEIDHILPEYHGGKTIRSNLVMACASCNNKKGSDLNLEMLTRAFRHLLDKGEDLFWLDTIPEAFENG